MISVLILTSSCKEDEKSKSWKGSSQYDYTASETQRMKELKGYRLGDFMDDPILKKTTVGGLNGSLLVRINSDNRIFEISFVSEVVTSGESNNRFHNSLQERYNIKNSLSGYQSGYYETINGIMYNIELSEQDNNSETWQNVFTMTDKEIEKGMKENQQKKANSDF